MQPGTLGLFVSEMSQDLICLHWSNRDVQAQISLQTLLVLSGFLSCLFQRRANANSAAREEKVAAALLCVQRRAVPQLLRPGSVWAAAVLALPSAFLYALTLELLQLATKSVQESDLAEKDFGPNWISVVIGGGEDCLFGFIWVLILFFNLKIFLAWLMSEFFM